MADPITEQNRIDTALAVPSQAPVTEDVLNVSPPPAPPPMLAPELSPAQMSMPGPPTMGPVPQLPAPAHQSAGNQMLGLAALAASLFGGKNLAGAPAAGTMQSFQRQDQFQAHQWQQQQALQHQAQQVYQQQQNEYTDRLQQRQAMLKSEMDKMQPFVAASTDQEDYNKRIAIATRHMQALGFKVSPEWMMQGTDWNPPDLSAQAQGIVDKFIKRYPFLANAPDSDEAKRIFAGPVKVTVKGVGEVQKKVGEMFNLANWQPTPAGMRPGMTKEAANNFSGLYLANKAAKEAQLKHPIDPGSPDDMALRAETQAQLDKQEAQSAVVKGKAMQAAGLAGGVNGPGGDSGVLAGLNPRIQQQANATAARFGQEPAVKTAQKVAEGFSFAKRLSDTTKNPADDQGLIYAFAKAMDPESVVREGEYATVQKYATSWMQSFGINVQRMFENKPFLTPEARRNLKATIASRYAASRQSYDNIAKEYANKIVKQTGRPDAAGLITDYAQGFPGMDEQAGGSGGGNRVYYDANGNPVQR